MQRLLDRTIALGQEIGLLPTKSELAAVDGTGLESTTASRYFVKRCEKTDKKRVRTTYRRFPKIGVVADCRSHLVLAVVHDRGPSPDVRHFRQALDQAHRRLTLTTLLADAGYDSEASHVYAREQRGVRSLIPAKTGRPTDKPPKGRYRRLMNSRIHSRSPRPNRTALRDRSPAHAGEDAIRPTPSDATTDPEVTPVTDKAQL